MAAARLRARPGRTALVLLGVAISVAMLVGVFGGSLIARERAVQRAVAALPRRERSFRVDIVGLPAQQGYRRTNRAASAALAGLAAGEPLRASIVRDFWLQGEFVRLVGVDGLSGRVRLLSGRLPRSCRPEACEVLQIGPKGRPSLREGPIHLVRVGIAELRDPASLGPAFEPLRQERAQDRRVTSIVLVPPDSRALERLPAFQLLPRVRSWVAPIEPSSIRSWQIDGLLRRESRAQTLLRESDPSFTLSGPDTALLDARDRGTVSGQRMVLIGGGASALLLGFAMVAAVGLRRGLATERRRLLQRGATRGQVWLAVLLEIAAVTLAGWLLGLAAGAAGVAALARALGLPAGAVLEHALLRPQAALVLAGAWVIATVVVALTAVAGEREDGRRRLGLLDVVALGALVALVVGLARGGLSAETLSGGGDRTLLLLLPGLVCVIAAVAAARLLGPLMLLAERAARRGPAALRLALLALARAPARTAIAAAFLVVSVGLALFAAGYRATLDRGARDEAGFAVPLDVTLSQGSKPAQPLDAAPVARYESLAPGVRAYPVVRLPADVPGLGSSGQGVTVLGIPAQGLGAMYWRSDFSSVSHGGLEQRLSRDGPAALRGVEMPPGTASLGLRVRVQGTPIELALALRGPDGGIRIASFGRVKPGDAGLSVPVGHATELVALEAYLAASERDWLFNLANHGRVVRAPSGSVTLRELTARDAEGRARPFLGWRGWVARDGGVRRTAAGARLSYAFPDVRTVLLRPRQPTDGSPLRVVVSPDVAAAAGPGGLLTLDFHDPQLTARIVGVADRFPTLQPDEPFVVAEESRLATALDAGDPGTGRPGELWLSAPGGSLPRLERALAQPPFSGLARAVRRSELAALDRDPLARGIGATLGVAALLALVLAVVGLWATLLSDLRDERGDFFDLEAQGVAPETLRRHLRLRALALLLFGIVGGSLLGYALSRLVVSLVQVSAQTTAPVPPLVFSPGAATAALVVALLALAAVAAAELSVRHAFRGEIPERASWGLE